jgi:surface rod structure-forming protein G/transglycosylase-like protein with SLT domain
LKVIQSKRLLRVAALALVTFVALGAGWQAAVVAGASARSGDAATLPRAEGEARGLVRTAAADPAASREGASGRSIVLAGGLPVTVVDGSSSRALRVSRGATAAEVLEAAGLSVGPLDRVETSAASSVDSGDVVRVVRVSESVETVREPIAFAVTSTPDSTLVRGKTVVVTAGVMGLAENTYRVTVADGAVEQRTLVASTELQAPVAEVRRVGTQAPPVPGNIESIIRAAAATWGADPDQLLRVAWCESRYNPNAYNASSGASGLFQFMPRTFAVNSVRAGYGGASIFDPVASANTAAYMFVNGQARQWSCK